jgi:hypothetical protein
MRAEKFEKKQFDKKSQKNDLEVKSLLRTESKKRRRIYPKRR